MLRVTFRSLWEHKRRLISTIVAIMLGVAFMAGTFVLTDTLDRVFDDLFGEANDQIATQVQGEVLFDDPLTGEQRALLDPGLVDKITTVDGVAAVRAHIITFAAGSTNRVLGSDGKAIGATQGPPTILESWIDEPALTAYRIKDGRGPESDDEMALNVAAVDDAEVAVGDEITVVTQFGPEQYKLVGTFTYGTAGSIAGAVTAEFTPEEAARLAGTDGKATSILAAADDGVSEIELTERIAKVLPGDVEAITGTEAAAQTASSVKDGFSFFKIILSVFGAIALVVGAFVISNTFAILVAQRTRELALLRAIGASRGQVLGSVLLEAVAVGLTAAAGGLVAGVGLAKGVTALLAASGADLPTTSLLVRPATVVIALVLGLAVTLLAALVPAIRATRVPPLAALRDVAVERAGVSRARVALGALTLLAGAFCLSSAWTDGTTDALPTVGLGALVVLVGAIVIGPVLASPSIRMLGTPLPSFKGITGKLATENAARSPKRTSATASALIIGVALVGFITVFASSAKQSITAEVERGFKGDFVVQADTGGFGGPGGFPSSVADQVAAVKGVEVVVPVAFAGGEVTYPNGETGTTFIGAVEPTQLSEVLNARMQVGEVSDLSDDGIIVDEQVAKDHKLALGDQMKLTVAGGGVLELRVQAISNDPSLLGNYTVTGNALRSVSQDQADFQVYGKLAQGADIDTVLADIEKAVSSTPGLEVLDRDGFIGDLASQITSFVTFIYGLLILSIIIALIGIANTLSLSIHERTRELGLLRAVGMNRRQLRSTVRWEAVLISVLGTLVGLGIGLILSYALITALKSQGLSSFAVPVGSLVVITVGAALLGTMASILPARRAARLGILQAIAED